MNSDYKTQIFQINSDEQLNKLALQAFHYQINNLGIYANYVSKLKVNANEIKHYSQIPFLPIEFFKSHKVIAKSQQAQVTFTSSGTTGMVTSKHLVSDLNIYEQSFTAAFNQFYGNESDYCILALLPSYLQRDGSSLVYMADHLIKMSKHPKSGFYLDNYQELAEILRELNSQGQKVILLGVTYALLDMAEQFDLNLNHTIVMETGGMKGRRKEMIREELHKILCTKLGVKSIHSEYGMTELLSQGYSKGNGIFDTPQWMKILIRDTYDPFCYLPTGRSGGINVIDLANINSCCFIETKDLGKTFADDTFTILGRFDDSDIRGCNLMVS